KIAYYLAKHMADTGIDMKIIEQDEERCIELSEALPRATVICGDGTDHAVLKEEGLLDSDACVVLTGIDEENIVVSLYAKSKGVDKVITKIDRASFAAMAEIVGVDCHVSPKFITANRIVRYVRAMQDSGESSMKTLYKIVNNQVEALEFAVETKSFFTDIPIKDLKTKRGMLFASIIRHGKVIIPGGDDHIETGDSIIIITTTNGYVKNLEDIFA
ncbi:MAG: NAD-binding protein, partial [Clostridia bacterium]|nr:NAD-binding protein [Clostridia bacterium]